MKRQSDGFSLVEVIIAIAVLAVIAMSLLLYFSNASRYAEFGKTKQRADMAAQSVVEELASCTTFEQIEEKLVEPDDSAWTVVSTPSAGKNNYLLSRKISVDSMDYKAMVTLDFDSYKATASATTTPVSKFNDYQAPQLEKVYSENNVVLEETDQTDAAVRDIFYQVYKNDKTITTAAIRDGLGRVLHIDMMPYTGDPDSADLYLVRGRYEYQYEKAGVTYQCEMSVKDVKIEEDKLQKIYLFYRPVNSILNEETLDITATGMPAGFDLSKFSFYAVLQQEETVTPPYGYHLEITSAGNPTTDVLKNKVYCNTEGSAGSSDGLIIHKPKDRIATVTVEVYYEDETDFNEENRIIRVQTSKGA